MVADLCCDLQIHVDGQQTFFLSQKIMSAYSRRLRKMTTMHHKIALNDFPGGGAGFELVSRFCYNNGAMIITTHNVSILYCSAIYLGMTDTLLPQTEAFLKGIFSSHSRWEDLFVCLRSCEGFFPFAEASDLIDKFITTLLPKIAHNSENSLLFSPSYASPSSSDSFPKEGLGKPKAWWFDDLGTLSPVFIHKVIKNLGAYGSSNNSLLLTKFPLHYLKTKKNCSPKSDLYSGLADTAVYGVILMGKPAAFSFRALFWMLRLGCRFGLSEVCQSGLEKLIGSMLDSAKLDDLTVSSIGHNINCHEGVYDVNLVVRLVRVFVQCQGISLQGLNKVAWLIDQYLAEISPDQNLKISKFMAVAQSLPDMARDCFDGVYRAIDIYLESHRLSFEDRSRLCKCLNYEKLSLEACKDVAKNPRIPPRLALQALASQKPVDYDPPAKTIGQSEYFCKTPDQKRRNNYGQMVHYGSKGAAAACQHDEEEEYNSSISKGSQDMKLNIQRMQWRLVQLEKLCREMKVKCPSW